MVEEVGEGLVDFVGVSPSDVVCPPSISMNRTSLQAGRRASANGGDVLACVVPDRLRLAA
jgi:hypothetical protein